MQAKATAEVSGVWNDLRAKREGLKSFHQEFDVANTIKSGDHSQTWKSSVSVDGAAARWRVRSVSGAGDEVTLFDGGDQFKFEDDGDEYVRLKLPPQGERPEPEPYNTLHMDFSKAVEREHRPCGLSNVDHECVIIDIPTKPWTRFHGSDSIKTSEGNTRVVIDTVTGLLLSSRSLENVNNASRGYQTDTTYLLKRMTYNGDADQSLFHVPSSAMTEVKELSAWNAAKMKKQLAGKAAPGFALTDIQGKTVKLGDLKGQTVLLDFWTTWCGPCRADGPSLDKLHEKYGGKNLTIIGVSVSEERSVVQKFLSEHPHQYSIALTTENELPRQYQIGVFPTYIVIDPDGNLASAVEGDKGFSELRKLLKKAGLETD